MHLLGAEAIAALVASVNMVKQTRWTCAGTSSCPATPKETFTFCVECHLVWCRHCGGPRATWAPIEAFICVHCLVKFDYSEPLLPPPSGASAEYATAARKAALKPLVRGRMHILASSLRASTMRHYASDRNAFRVFCSSIDVEPFPASPAMIMDFAVHCIIVKQLDSSTTVSRLRAVGSFYDYARNRLYFRHCKNPLRDPEILEMLRLLGVHFKKPGGGRIALSAAELVGLFLSGFTAQTRRGRWARMTNLLLNFGMLRYTAAGALRVCYSILPNGSIVFLPAPKLSSGLILPSVRKSSKLLSLLIKIWTHAKQQRTEAGARLSQARFLLFLFCLLRNCVPT